LVRLLTHVFLVLMEQQSPPPVFEIHLSSSPTHPPTFSTRSRYLSIFWVLILSYTTIYIAPCRQIIKYCRNSNLKDQTCLVSRNVKLPKGVSSAAEKAQEELQHSVAYIAAAVVSFANREQTIPPLSFPHYSPSLTHSETLRGNDARGCLSGS
jgi:hypothetical protein